MSLQQKIDRITDILLRDDGISGAMHDTEQTSWILFLKILDDYEAEKADDAILSGIDDSPLEEKHRRRKIRQKPLGLLQNMGDSGGYAGEFYTPRPVV